MSSSALRRSAAAAASGLAAELPLGVLGGEGAPAAGAPGGGVSTARTRTSFHMPWDCRGAVHMSGWSRLGSGPCKLTIWAVQAWHWSYARGSCQQRAPANGTLRNGGSMGGGVRGSSSGGAASEQTAASESLAVQQSARVKWHTDHSPPLQTSPLPTNLQQAAAQVPPVPLPILPLQAGLCRGRHGRRLLGCRGRCF